MREAVCDLESANARATDDGCDGRPERSGKKELWTTEKSLDLFLVCLSTEMSGFPGSR